ncbi:hypothetical protein DFH29DRAFT_994592 [Suillus ampliporus]|nr:hypothetical protein DFH29DRAFT_994592 [Suillus ampliporus]
MVSQAYDSIFDPGALSDTSASDHDTVDTSSKANMNAQAQDAECMTLTWQMERGGQLAASTINSGKTGTAKHKNPGHLKKKKATEETDVPVPPPPTQVTYYLLIFSEAELHKAEKQRKSLNSFLQQTADLPFDTLKAQLLTQILAKLNPSKISYDDYDIDWTVPWIQLSPLALASDSDYKFLLQHATKHKEPQANITIKARMNKENHYDRDTDTSSGEDDVGSENESEDDKRPKKKMKKTSAKEKAKVLETNLNIKINMKIQQLRDRWMCSKPGCMSKFCFIHVEHPEHFLLGHEHLSVWVAAWNRDEAQANLETPPNHAKFNTLPGKKGTVSLLQHHLAKRAQPANQPHGPVINFNIPPELLAVFRPPAVPNNDIPQPAPAGSHTEGD